MDRKPTTCIAFIKCRVLYRASTDMNAVEKTRILGQRDRMKARVMVCEIFHS